MLYLVDNEKNRVIGFYESPKSLKRGIDLLSAAERLPVDYHIATEEPDCFNKVILERMPPRTRTTPSNTIGMTIKPPVIKKKTDQDQ